MIANKLAGQTYTVYGRKTQRQKFIFTSLNVQHQKICKKYQKMK